MIEKPLRSLRDAIAREDYVLSENVYEEARAFLMLCEENPSTLGDLGRWCEPYDDDEFFEIVDRHGNPAMVAASVVSDYRELCKRVPMRALWFREGPATSGNSATLLVARWLAHLAGFRHPCVELFLDDAHRDGYTFLQVRSSAKLHAAGCFDVPLGAHVKAGSTEEKTLEEELEEELGLDLARDIQYLRFLEGYDFLDFPEALNLVTAEYLGVYVAQLDSAKLAKVAFHDGEVAALCLFSVKEVETMIRNQPDRVSSGLLGSYPVYAKKHP